MLNDPSFEKKRGPLEYECPSVIYFTKFSLTKNRFLKMKGSDFAYLRVSF